MTCRVARFWQRGCQILHLLILYVVIGIEFGVFVSEVTKMKKCNTRNVFRTFCNQQGCQIQPIWCRVARFFHFACIIGYNKLRNMILVSKFYNLRPRNLINILMTQYDLQGCQILATGLPDFTFINIVCCNRHRIRSFCVRSDKNEEM